MTTIFGIGLIMAGIIVLIGGVAILIEMLDEKPLKPKKLILISIVIAILYVLCMGFGSGLIELDRVAFVLMGG